MKEIFGTGSKPNELEEAVLSTPIELKEEDLETLVNMTGVQVVSTGFDMPFLRPGEFERITRRFTKTPPIQEHASKDERRGETSHDKRGPRPVLKAYRHIELELKGL